MTDNICIEGWNVFVSVKSHKGRFLNNVLKYIQSRVQIYVHIGNTGDYRWNTGWLKAPSCIWVTGEF